MKRSEMLERLKNEEFDVLVIGGGATGSYTTLDFASRGIKVACVDKMDFAEGTSGKSTKLIHGGVRYLEKVFTKLDFAQFKVVKDALFERHFLIKNAEHISEPKATIIPTYSRFQTIYFGFGMLVYEKVSGRRSVGKSRILSKSKTLQECSFLSPEGLRAGVRYYDGQFVDTRMNIDIVRTASKYNATIANYMEVVGFNKENDKIVAAQVEDKLTGEIFTVRAKAFVNAGGVFIDKIRHLDDEQAEALMEPSSGIHLVLNKSFEPPQSGFLIPKTDDGRVIFVLPWLGQTMVGTTDELVDEVTDRPVVSEKDIEYLLSYYNRYSSKHATLKDVKSYWSGLRPLIASKSESTAELVRDHTIYTAPSGLITMAGGKWTAVRRMAYDLVNFTLEHANLIQQHDCVTESVKLYEGGKFDPEGYATLQNTYNLDEDVAKHLNSFYAGNAHLVCDIIKEKGLGNRLAEGYPYVEAEVVYATRYELAQHGNDAIVRRIPLALQDLDAAKEALPKVVKLMGEELGWTAKMAKSELEYASNILDTAL